jgi:hypothetical protein
MRMARTILITPTALAVAALAACSSSNQSTSSSPSQPSASSTPSSSATGTHQPKAQHTRPASSPAAHATEFNPPGDIPDTQVFVTYRYPGSRVQVRVPEGWARSTQQGTTSFTDHYNSIALQVVRAAQPTQASVRSRDVPQLRRSVAKFAQPKVSQVTRAHGNAVLLTYLLDSTPDPVTGKVVRDAAERYAFWSHGQEAILTLTGPQNADNVDPWRLVSDSLQWR